MTKKLYIKKGSFYVYSGARVGVALFEIINFIEAKLKTIQGLV